MEQRPNNAGAVVRGWCPSAWRPMMAGDGLLVRVRPALSRMTAGQARGLCDVAATFGNGAIDLTNRAGLQIRGVREEGLVTVLERLVAIGLVAADPAVEVRPAILVAPDWSTGDESALLARQLADRLGELPILPGKVGFAVDLTGAPALTHAPADFRLERSATGRPIVRADGHSLGLPVTPADAVDRLLALACWFAETGGDEAGRMARHSADLPPELTGTEPPAAPRALIPGSHTLGSVLGVPFGRLDAGRLASLLTESGADALRITPWRQIVLEGVASVARVGFVLDADDPAMRVDACVGAPACPQATVETRNLALTLAPAVRGSLHVSGCAKGCARPAAAHIMLTGREGRFDLGHDARAGDPPSRSGLSADAILTLLGAA